MVETTNALSFLKISSLGKIRRFAICLFFSFLFISCSGATKKEIYASEILKLINKGESIQFYDKIILDDLDFSEAKDAHILSVSYIQKPVRSNIFFINCVFMGKVSATGLYQKMQKVVLFEKNVTFFSCDFRGDVNFDNMIVRGEFSVAKSVFRAPASFNQITVSGERNSFWEIEAEFSFDMVHAHFHGDVNFMDAKFRQYASFQAVTVNTLQFNNAYFSKEVDFSNSIIHGNTFFNYTKFEGNALFSYSKFFGNVDFLYDTYQSRSDFSNSFFYGQVRFNDTSFAGETDFSGSVFVQSPQVERISLKKEIEVQIIESKNIILK